MIRFKNGLRLWIIFSSIAGFLGGWVLIAHAPKPVAASPRAAQEELAPLPTLAPIPSIRQNRNFQPIQVLPQANNFSPRLRTGGS